MRKLYVVLLAGALFCTAIFTAGKAEAGRMIAPSDIGARYEFGTAESYIPAQAGEHKEKRRHGRKEKSADRREKHRDKRDHTKDKRERGHELRERAQERREHMQERREERREKMREYREERQEDREEYREEAREQWEDDTEEKRAVICRQSRQRCKEGGKQACRVAKRACASTE